MMKSVETAHENKTTEIIKVTIIKEIMLHIYNLIPFQNSEITYDVLPSCPNRGPSDDTDFLLDVSTVSNLGDFKDIV